MNSFIIQVLVILDIAIIALVFVLVYSKLKACIKKNTEAETEDVKDKTSVSPPKPIKRK